MQMAQKTGAIKPSTPAAQGIEMLMGASQQMQRPAQSIQKPMVTRQSPARQKPMMAQAGIKTPRMSQQMLSRMGGRRAAV